MDQEQTYKWIQERLRQLHSGTLSEADRLRLTEIAREDPFVADALEGFEAHPDIAHTEHLEKLTQKIRHTRRERRRWLIPNLTVTAVAASVLLIIATYMVITRIEKPAEENVLVMIAPDTLITDDTASVAATEPYMRMSGDEEQDAYTAAGSAEKESTGQADVKSAAKKQDPFKPAATTEKTTDVTSAAPSASSAPVTSPAAAASRPEDDQPPAAEDMAMESKVELSRAKKDEGYYANQMAPDRMNQRVTGHIADLETGERIANAKVILGYSNEIYYPDIQGNFEFFIPEKETVIQVQSAGYIDSTLVIRQGEENILVSLKTGDMAPPLAPFGAKNKGPVSAVKNPAVEAFLNIHRYIQSAALLELTSVPSNARRTVTVTFKVNNDGHPRNVSVMESSRDKNYDGEAIRLIESGPDWVCPGGEYPCVRRYTFYFR